MAHGTPAPEQGQDLDQIEQTILAHLQGIYEHLKSMMAELRYTSEEFPPERLDEIDAEVSSAEREIMDHVRRLCGKIARQQEHSRELHRLLKDGNTQESIRLFRFPE